MASSPDRHVCRRCGRASEPPDPCVCGSCDFVRVDVMGGGPGYFGVRVRLVEVEGDDEERAGDE